MMLEFSDEVMAYLNTKTDSSDPESIEKAIQFLKSNGVSQLQTVYLLNKQCEIPFNRANNSVMNSKAWNND